MPSYLIAIVAGLLESRDIGPRTKVWSEKEMVDAAAFEFAEVCMLLTLQAACKECALFGVKIQVSS